MKLFWKKENPTGKSSQLLDEKNEVLAEMTEKGNMKWTGRGQGLIAEVKGKEFHWRFTHHPKWWGIFEKEVVIEDLQNNQKIGTYRFKMFRMGSGNLILSKSEKFYYRYTPLLHRVWKNSSGKKVILQKYDTEWMLASGAEVDCMIDSPHEYPYNLLNTLGWYLIVIRSYQEKQAGKDLALKGAGKLGEELLKK